MSATDAASDYLEPLRKYWGYDSLRPMQEAAIRATLAGQDSLTVMPTGGGKSLCFQLPALMARGLTLVLSPLIALMKDQVDGLRLMGYPAAALNSSLSSAEESEVRAGLLNGDIRLLYVSPERLALPDTVALLQRAHGGVGVRRIAIDEAHCISAWGHDFRPEYRQLRDLHQSFTGAAIAAFTATATPRVREDILSQLALTDPQVNIGTFDRPNLTYRIQAKSNAVTTITEAIRRYPDEAVIVYCISRKDTERVAEALKSEGLSVAAYHAGLDTARRSRISEDFARERLNVVVATVAFGMGIDRSNVRCVIHESMPKSIEGYQQETGRAGRDGRASECIMLYSNGDYAKWARVMRESGDPHQMKLLDEVRRFATNGRCRHQFLSEYFGQSLPDKCAACDVCLDGVEQVEGSTRIAQRILVTAHDLIRESNPPGVAHLVQVLAGARTQEVTRRKHDQLRGYGCLKERSRPLIQAWVFELLDQGLLARSEGQYPVLQATEEGLAAIRDRREIGLHLPKSVSSEPTRSSARDANFDHLRRVRKQIADEMEVPAYVVFHDSVLAEIARRRPATMAQFLQVPGVGESKARKFGDQFLQAVAEFAPPEPARIPSEEATAPYYAAFVQGMSVADTAEALGKAVSTVEGYLERWIAEHPDALSAYVTPEREAAIRQAIKAVGHVSLRPIKDELPEDFTYAEIRLVRAVIVVAQIA